MRSLVALCPLFFSTAYYELMQLVFLGEAEIELKFAASRAGWSMEHSTRLEVHSPGVSLCSLPFCFIRFYFIPFISTLIWSFLFSSVLF
jgi:hypothetical protein